MVWSVRKEKQMTSYNDKAFHWLVGILIAVCFLVIVGYYVIIGMFIVKTADTINEQGLKSIIERVWEGKKAPPPNTTHLGDK